MTAPAPHDTDGDAVSRHATADDAPSAAELAFIDRVRRDRERARALRRRILVAGAVVVAATGMLSFTGALPRFSSGADVLPAATAPMTSDATLVAETIEQRLARLEARVNALENLAAADEPRAPGMPPTETTTARHAVDAAAGVPPPATVSTAAAPAAPRPPGTPVSTAPKAARPSSVQRRHIKAPSAESPKRVTVVPAARPTIRPVAAPEPTFGETVRRGWESVGRQVRRTPQDVRDGFDKVRRLFAD